MGIFTRPGNSSVVKRFRPGTGTLRVSMTSPTRWLSNALDLGMLLCRLWKFHDVGCGNVLLEGDRKDDSEVGPGCR